jgi:hypothetical protein
MNRARHSLWILTTAVIVFAGILAQALAAPAGPAADVFVAVSGLGLAISAVLLYRVMRVLSRAAAAPDRRPESAFRS